MNLHLYLDRNAPLQQQIYDQIRHAVLVANLAPGAGCRRRARWRRNSPCRATPC